MINLLKEAKIQTIGQNALNARAKMTDKDNLLHNLAEAIQVNVAPNFADVQIESEGDEWIGGASGATNPSLTLSKSAENSIDLSNLPNDLNGLLDALLEAAAHGEAKSPEAYNNGTDPCNLSKSKPRGDGKTFITKMTPIQIIARRNNSCDTKLFATGIWQTIPDTLQGAINSMPELKNQPYTRENQKKVALWLIMKDPIRKDLTNFLTGKSNNIDRAQQVMGMIWASIPVPAGKSITHKRVSDGTKSYYESKNNHANKQSGILVRSVLLKIQQYHQQNTNKQ